MPLLSPDQMRAEDRNVVESWRSAIATSARFYGYDVDSSFSYREIACPVAPSHLLLAYESTGVNGSISRFTAVIERRAGQEPAGRRTTAQIIPILHSGVVPFVRAIKSPHSIEVFNAAVSPAPTAIEALAAAQKGSEPLLIHSLCYLAMVGEQPSALEAAATNPSRGQAIDDATIHAPVPTLAFARRGQMRQMVSIRGSSDDYQVWTLDFVSGGGLLSVSRTEHAIDRTPLVLKADAAEPEFSDGVAARGGVAAPASAQSSLPMRAVSVPGGAPALATSTRPSTIKSLTSAPSTSPQPSLAPVAPSAPAMVVVPPASPSVADSMPPPVKPAPPLPRSRFYINPPLPPGKFIPDSALKTPPHLPIAVDPSSPR